MIFKKLLAHGKGVVRKLRVSKNSKSPESETAVDSPHQSLPDTKSLPNEVTHLEDGAPTLQTKNASLPKAIPLVKFPKADAIDLVLKNLPCKANHVPNQKILNAFREFEDAYESTSHTRQTAALTKLLQCLPFQSDLLNQNLQSALRALQSAYQNNHHQPRDARAPDVPPRSGLEPNKPNKTLTKSVFAIVDQSINLRNIVEKIGMEYRVVSTHITPAHRGKSKIFMNFTTAEAAEMVVQRSWSSTDGRLIQFRLQYYRS